MGSVVILTNQHVVLRDYIRWREAWIMVAAGSACEGPCVVECVYDC